MKRQYATGLVLMLALAMRSEAFITPRHISLGSIDKNTRESMDLNAQFLDENVKLAHNPEYRMLP
jgi:hypothetical protein